MRPAVLCNRTGGSGRDLSADAGLCVADGYGAEMLRDAPRHPLPAATRKEMLIRIARLASNRMQRLYDPELGWLDQ